MNSKQQQQHNERKTNQMNEIFVFNFQFFPHFSRVFQIFKLMNMRETSNQYTLLPTPSKRDRVASLQPTHSYIQIILKAHLYIYLDKVPCVYVQCAVQCARCTYHLTDAVAGCVHLPRATVKYCN